MSSSASPAGAAALLATLVKTLPADELATRVDSVCAVGDAAMVGAVFARPDLPEAVRMHAGLALLSGRLSSAVSSGRVFSSPRIYGVSPLADSIRALSDAAQTQLVKTALESPEDQVVSHWIRSMWEALAASITAPPAAELIVDRFDEVLEKCVSAGKGAEVAADVMLRKLLFRPPSDWLSPLVARAGIVRRIPPEWGQPWISGRHDAAGHDPAGGNQMLLDGQLDRFHPTVLQSPWVRAATRAALLDVAIDDLTDGNDTPTLVAVCAAAPWLNVDQLTRFAQAVDVALHDQKKNVPARARRLRDSLRRDGGLEWVRGLLAAPPEDVAKASGRVVHALDSAATGELLRRRDIHPSTRARWMDMHNDRGGLEIPDPHQTNETGSVLADHRLAADDPDLLLWCSVDRSGNVHKLRPTAPHGAAAMLLTNWHLLDVPIRMGASQQRDVVQRLADDHVRAGTEPDTDWLRGLPVAALTAVLAGPPVVAVPAGRMLLEALLDPAMVDRPAFETAVALIAASAGSVDDAGLGIGDAIDALAGIDP